LGRHSSVRAWIRIRIRIRIRIEIFSWIRIRIFSMRIRNTAMLSRDDASSYLPLFQCSVRQASMARIRGIFYGIGGGVSSIGKISIASWICVDCCTCVRIKVNDVWNKRIAVEPQLKLWQEPEPWWGSRHLCQVRRRNFILTLTHYEII
jgi:hypothetical protein